MMGDLISRWDAIDAISSMFAPTPTQKDMVEDCLEIIENLPSAQSEIIRCKDCQHANECHKSVQFTRNEPNTVTIGYSPIEWCSRGERREE